MERGDLRARALDAIRGVAWTPAWGEERISNMLASRPDWCISRQRAWGVPIPAMDCTGCQEPLLTPQLVERAATVFERDGADAWWERPIEDFLPEGLSCPSCGGASFTREHNILDVWFDSGSSHEGVLAVHPELQWPADLYFEGSDQYREWFHSSLLVGLGTRGRAPYREVATHGFVVTEDGKKMSKSLGNAVDPGDILRVEGADPLRWYLLTASPAWVPTRFDREGVKEAQRKLLATLENTYTTFNPEHVSKIKHEAAVILKAHDQNDDAIGLFRETEEWIEVAQLISKQAPAAAALGRLQTLEAWIGALPGTIVGQNPWLLYWTAHLSYAD